MKIEQIVEASYGVGSKSERLLEQYFDNDERLRNDIDTMPGPLNNRKILNAYFPKDGLVCDWPVRSYGAGWKNVDYVLRVEVKDKENESQFHVNLIDDGTYTNDLSGIRVSKVLYGK